MVNRRKFNQSERAALFIHAQGKCQMCGNDLEQSWHADHVHPHSKRRDTRNRES